MHTNVTEGRFVSVFRRLAPVLLIALLILPCAFAQETTAGLQGTIKDSSGGVIGKANVEVTSPALIGMKKLETDSAGYFRFANLPPGTYALTVTATGFRTFKSNVELEVGHLPTLDITMQIGTATETVEVSEQAALVDVTTSKVQTNVTANSLMNLPTQSLSFQSVIQFAPGARSEPLQGGYQINGASNSENAYLVGGQETASIYDGHSQANVPMDFIQEVQVKTNGFEAEYGGALGGVVNVIQKSGSNEWHGSIFANYNSDRFNAAPSPNLIKNPQFAANSNGAKRYDQPMEYYYPIKDHRRIVDPGFTLGGDLVKDRLWAFVSGAPNFDNLARTVNFTFPGAVGARTFHDTTNTYYSIARLDFLATQKIRLYGSWQYNYQRETGSTLPQADEVHGQFNTSSTQNPDIYNSSIGAVRPNLLYNTGADITISPTVVATTRFGYFTYNTQDRGKPTGIQYTYRDTNYPYATGNAPALAGTKNLNGSGTLPSQFVNSAGYTNIGGNSQTQFDLWQRYSLNQDLSFFKTFHGVHNFKVGYGFMHATDDTLVGYNTADVYVAFGVPYQPTTAGGKANCAKIVGQNLSQYGTAGGNADGTACQGLWGTVNLRDLSTGGKVGGWNHSFYVQDAWTVGKYLTLNLGVRLDKENLPSYDKTTGYQGISFGWGQKVAPRLGAAYDLLHNGKVKVYGSFGYFYDIMKYNLPQGSFGGQYWHDCVYAMDDPNYFGIIPQRDASANHTPYCPATGGGSPANGLVPNARFIENVDYREPANAPSQIGSLGATGLVDPNLKPMKQHVMTIGAAWELSHNMVFEPIYTRSRLDRTIEDSGVITADGEIYYIVNPGIGVNATVPNCTACPANPKAVRNYDGLELRLTRRFSGNWFGSFSYTYSRLYGNYSGLTATDVSDGGAARNGANTDRAFDEPFMSFDAHGNVINGPLGTDRPHAIKINAYYSPRWGKFAPTIGLFEQAYSGTPLGSYMSVAGAPVFLEGRGKFVNVSRDATTGNWIPGSVSDARTPRFAQTDVSVFQDFHVNKNNERMVARIGVDCINCLNQHHVTIINQNLLRTGLITPYQCSGAACGPSITDQQAGFNYAQLEKGYDYIALANSTGTTLNSLYGSPQSWQAKRTMRFQVRFTF